MHEYLWPAFRSFDMCFYKKIHTAIEPRISFGLYLLSSLHFTYFLTPTWWMNTLSFRKKPVSNCKQMFYIKLINFLGKILALKHILLMIYDLIIILYCNENIEGKNLLGHAMLLQSFAKTTVLEPWHIWIPPYLGGRHKRVRLKVFEVVLFELIDQKINKWWSILKSV